MSQYDLDAERLGDICEGCGKTFFECDCPEAEDGCISCGCPLGLPGGMGGTGLCGPCCIGEANTIDEIGETW